MVKKIEIVVGFKCNNNCKFCSVGTRNFEKSLEQVKKEIIRAARERPDEINFTGGEPTIRKDIFEMISYARDRVDSVRITTNGRLLYYGWFAKRLVDAGLTGAIFSLHAPTAGVHDNLTSVKGSFEQLTMGMGNLSRLVKDISVNTVITTLNYRLLPGIVSETIDKFDVKRYCLIYPTLYGSILDNKSLIPAYEDVKPYVHKALEIARKRGKTGWALNIPPCFLEKEERYSTTMPLNTIMYWPDMRTDLDMKKYEDKIKTENCLKCKFGAACPGIPKDYCSLKMKGNPSAG